MLAFLDRYPFFSLVETEQEALMAVETIACYATADEREHLLPQIIRLKHDIRVSQGGLTLHTGLNNLLAGYLALYGEFSDKLVIMLSEDLQRFRSDTEKLEVLDLEPLICA